ncbi:MAG: tyrosine-type recombinase/integrase [Acidimicrobiia bacterium]
MSELRRHLDDYLAVRRAVGFKLDRAELLLADFIDYLDSRGIDHVTVDAALGWAALPPNPLSNWHTHRLSVVRGFARYLHVIDAAHQIPPTKVFPTTSQRATPFLYSEADIAALMAAAHMFGAPLRAATLETVIGLLAVTGVRIGEALGLDRDDIDTDGGMIHVNNSKFGKSRRVPIHASTVEALGVYARVRDRLSPRPASPAMFVSLAGTRLLYCNFHAAWLKIVEQAGLGARSPKCRPRPHDIRHTFAVRTLLGWYRNGDDVAALMPRLSTFLGHVHPANTYWYLTATPELLALTVERLETIGETS